MWETIWHHQATQIILGIIVINWGLTLIAWAYPLVMGLIFKDFVFDGFHGPFAKFLLATEEDTDDPIEPWHAKAWAGWGGLSLHWFMCYTAHNKRMELHEGAHCWQQAACGLIWWAIYFGHMLWILITQKIKGKPYTKHAYLDIVWERMARKRAGQPVNIPPKDWPHGEGDLFPWR